MHEESRRCPLIFEGRGNGFLFFLQSLANAEIQSTTSQLQLNDEIKYDYESAEYMLVLLSAVMGLRFGEEFVQLKLKCRCSLQKSHCTRPTPSNISAHL